MFVLESFTIVQLLSELRVFLIYTELYVKDLLKNLTIVKNPHTNTDSVLNIKFHKSSF